MAIFPKVNGISRDGENEKVLLLSLAGRPTDDEMRAIHDLLLDQFDNFENIFNRMRALDDYRERYEKLREALIDALGPQADTLISLAVQ